MNKILLLLLVTAISFSANSMEIQDTTNVPNQGQSEWDRLPWELQHIILSMACSKCTKFEQILDKLQKLKKSPLFSSIVTDENFIKILAKKYVEQNKEQAEKEFLDAIDKYKLDLAKLLVESGVKLTQNNKIDREKLRELLNHTVFRYEPETMELLITAGININESNCSQWHMPLSYAASKNYKKLVQVLLNNNAQVNLRDKNHMTALMYANESESCQLLIDAGADINAQDNDGNTALILICQRCDYYNNEYTDTVKLLIKAGTDVNIQNNDGETALLKAIRFGHKEIVELLLKSGADINIQNNDGKRALDLAWEKMFNNYGSLKMHRIRSEIWHLLRKFRMMAFHTFD